MRTFILLAAAVAALITVTTIGVIALDQLVFYIVLAAFITTLTKGFIEGARQARNGAAGE